MIIKCEKCGQDVEASADLADGQHVRCPFCGDKFTYRKHKSGTNVVNCPHCGARHDVDSAMMYHYSKCKECGKGFVLGATTSLLSTNVDQKLPDDRAQRIEHRKPKVGIKRAETNRTTDDILMEDRLRATINPQPVQTPKYVPKSVVTAAEERVRIYEEMRNKAARTKMLRNFIESAMLLMMLVVVVGLCLWWKDHKNKVAAEAARIEAEAEKQRMELEEAMRIQKELEQQQRDAEKARQDAAKKKEEEEKAAEEARKKKEQEAKEQELRDNRERYAVYVLAIRENKFDLFTKAVTNGIESTDSELCYLFPHETTTCVPLYRVVCSTNGSACVFRMEKSGQCEELDFEEFREKTENLEYLVAKGDTVYFKSRRKAPQAGLLNISEESNPAKAFFGTIANTLMAMKPTYDELTFDIYFTPRGKPKDKIFVENLPFGCAWSRRNVMDAIEKKFLIASSLPSSGSKKKKKFKRTVKIWDGAMIKKGIDGITYVPRTCPTDRVRYTTTLPNTIYSTRTIRYHNDSERWAALHAQALREDAEEAAFYERQNQIAIAHNASAQFAAESEWRNKLDKIFREGTLSYRIRKAKVEE